MPQNNTKENVEVLTPIARHLFSLIDTPIANIQRELTDLATQTLTKALHQHRIGRHRVRRGCRDLIQTRHRRRHLLDVARKPTPKSMDMSYH